MIWSLGRLCANDLEFGVVRLGVGIGEGVVWGPYIDRDEEEEDMDVDEYDGSDQYFLFPHVFRRNPPESGNSVGIRRN